MKNNLQENYNFIGFDEVNNILTLQREWRDHYYDQHIYFNRVTYLSSLMEVEGPKCLLTTYPTNKSIPGVYENRFNLQYCIFWNGQNDLPARIKKAFAALIKYNLDEMKIENEAY